MKVFVNLTNHKLTDRQVEEVKKMADKIIEKEEIFDNDVLSKLRQSPSDFVELKQLAKEVAKRINEVKEKEGEITIHLPIGSPLFQSLLFNELAKIPNIEFAYSHTKRIVEENPETGEKKSKFEFEKFITFNTNDLGLKKYNYEIRKTINGKRAIFDREGNKLSPEFDYIHLPHALLEGRSNLYIAEENDTVAIYDINGGKLTRDFDYIYFDSAYWEFRQVIETGEIPEGWKINNSIQVDINNNKRTNNYLRR